LPVFQTRTKAVIESAGVRTSRMTVFTIPPRNVTLEIGNQLVWRREPVATLFAFDMSVIALTTLVVVA